MAFKQPVGDDPMTDDLDEKTRGNTNLIRWVRNRFFTGVIISLPIVVTIWGVSWLVQNIDENVVGLLPRLLNPRTYLGFDIPGLGLIIAVLLLFAVGVFASNFIGNAVISAGERLLARVPVVSPLYGGLKQIVTTVAQQKDRAFRDVCLIEYPKAGIWAIGFVTADLNGAPLEHLSSDHVCVFVPTTPNPTSGFLLFAKRSDIKILNMTPEEGAKMIISGGMVSSNDPKATLKKAMPETLRKTDPGAPAANGISPLS